MCRGKLCPLLLSCAALIGCLRASAFAADLSIRKAPVYAPFTWTGFYGGVNLGYGWGDPQITSVVTAFVEPGPGATRSAASATSNSARSALGGFQAGYNLQTGSWVYGVETDLSVTKLQAVGPVIGTSTSAFAGIDAASLQTTSSATASIDRLPRQRVAEFLRSHLHARWRRRRREDHRIRLGRANESAPGSTAPASVPNHCSSSAA